MAGDEYSGPYTFSVGAWRRFGVPEAVVIGLPEGMGAVLVNAYVRRAAAGERFVTGVRYKDFFEGLPIVLERVFKGWYFEYFGSAFLLHPKGDFPAVQLIVPTEGRHLAVAPARAGGLRPLAADPHRERQTGELDAGRQRPVTVHIGPLEPGARGRGADRAAGRLRRRGAALRARRTCRR